MGGNNCSFFTKIYEMKILFNMHWHESKSISNVATTLENSYKTLSELLKLTNYNNLQQTIRKKNLSYSNKNLL